MLQIVNKFMCAVIGSETGNIHKEACNYRSKNSDYGNGINRQNNGDDSSYQGDSREISVSDGGCGGKAKPYL